MSYKFFSFFLLFKKIILFIQLNRNFFSFCNDFISPICYTNFKTTVTEAYKGGPHILETICTLAEQSLPFDAIGISTAGQVNPEEGYIIYANSNIPDYTGTQFQKILQERFHVPVAVENDVNSASASPMEPVSVVRLLKINRFTTVLPSQQENLVPSSHTQKKSSPVQTRLTDVMNVTLPLLPW